MFQCVKIEVDGKVTCIHCQQIESMESAMPLNESRIEKQGDSNFLNISNDELMMDSSKNDIDSGSTSTNNEANHSFCTTGETAMEIVEFICKTKGLTYKIEDKFIHAAANIASVTINIGMIDSDTKNTMISEIRNVMTHPEFDKRALYGKRYKIFCAIHRRRIPTKKSESKRQR